MQPALRLVSQDYSSDFGGVGPSSPKNGNGAKRKSTVLVVEDEVLTRLAIADYLRKNNYRVLEASTGEEAQTILRAGEPIEVVFSDVSMPGRLNGFELANWIRGEYPGVRMLLTSGADHLARQPGYGQVDGPVLAKPYVFEAVLAHINRLLLR
jgi:CheY-like chemotaxis protein